MMISSPGSQRLRRVRWIAGLVPAVTQTSLRSYLMPKSRSSERETASRSCGRPAAAVYLVCPASIAAMPPLLGTSGVRKSGSPAEREITSLPLARSSAARAVMARVADSEISSRVLEIFTAEGLRTNAVWAVDGEQNPGG
jgi:hypothetical protein